MDLKELQKIIENFRDERDWKQFHTPKDLTLALSIEVSEIAEHFLWKTEEATTAYLADPQNKEEVEDEMGDALAYLLELASLMDVDLEKAFIKKLEKSALKYPIEKAKGNSNKYTDLKN